MRAPEHHTSFHRSTRSFMTRAHAHHTTHTHTHTHTHTRNTFHNFHEERPCLVPGELRDLLHSAVAHVAPKDELVVSKPVRWHELLVMDRPLDRAYLNHIICTYIYTYMYTYIYIYTHIHIYVLCYIYVCVYIYTYIHYIYYVIHIASYCCAVSSCTAVSCIICDGMLMLNSIALHTHTHSNNNTRTQVPATWCQLH